VRSLYQRFSSFDVAAVNALLEDMQQKAADVVAKGSFGAPVRQSRIAFMRYVGQGHEIPVPLPPRALTEEDVAVIRADYDREYSRFYDRPVPGSDVEIMGYAVTVATLPDGDVETPAKPNGGTATPARQQAVRDTVTGEVSDWPIHDRANLAQGARLSGPAIIAENETSTLVGPGWSAGINQFGYIELERGAA
jgi:N-methylhydantoinase A